MRSYFPAVFSAAMCASLWVADAATIKKPEIASRAAWGAKPAEPTLMTPQPKGGFNGIVVHANDVYFRQREGVSNAEKIRRVQNGHMIFDHQWGDIAYHYFIAKDGWIAEARSLAYIGDSGTTYDMNAKILVVLEGNFEGGEVTLKDGTKEVWEPDLPTAAQKRSLDRLVAWLAKQHKIDAQAISAHKDHVITRCPGQKLMAYLPELRSKTKKALTRR